MPVRAQIRIKNDEMIEHEPAMVKCIGNSITNVFRKITSERCNKLYGYPLNSERRLKDLHAKRSAAKKIAKDLLDTAEKEKRSMTESEIDAFDVCTALLDDFSTPSMPSRTRLCYSCDYESGRATRLKNYDCKRHLFGGLARP